MKRAIISDIHGNLEALGVSTTDLGYEDWDGSLELSYSIPLIDLHSRAAERHGLLPWEVRSDSGAPAWRSSLSARSKQRASGT